MDGVEASVEAVPQGGGGASPHHGGKHAVRVFEEHGGVDDGIADVAAWRGAELQDCVHRCLPRLKALPNDEHP